MVVCSKVNVKLPDTQLKRLKTAVKNKTGTALRINLKMFNANDFAIWIIIDNKTKNKTKKCFS